MRLRDWLLAWRSVTQHSMYHNTRPGSCPSKLCLGRAFKCLSCPANCTVCTLHEQPLVVVVAADGPLLPDGEEDLQEQAAREQHYAQQDQQQQEQQHPQHQQLLHNQQQQQPPAQQQQPQPQQQGGLGLGKKKGGGLTLGGGLQLAVGSHMETGEWKSNGVWVKKDKQAAAVPSNLQVIAAEDLVKVSQQLRVVGVAAGHVQ